MRSPPATGAFPQPMHQADFGRSRWLGTSAARLQLNSAAARTGVVRTRCTQAAERLPTTPAHAGALQTWGWDRKIRRAVSYRSRSFLPSTRMADLIVPLAMSKQYWFNAWQPAVTGALKSVRKVKAFRRRGSPARFALQRRGESRSRRRYRWGESL